MEPRSHVRSRSQKSEFTKGEGSNWMLVAGGALLSSIFVHLGYKLKQALDARRPSKAARKDDGHSADRRRSGTPRSHPIVYTYRHIEDGFLNCNSGYNQENCLELPCPSDSGSDVYAKREVIQKLRQQLKKRDDMILEIQDQIAELQNELSRQVSHANNLQSQLDSANKDLFDSEREIQRLRKAIADHCVSQTEFNERNAPATAISSEDMNSHANGYAHGDRNPMISEKCKGDGEKIETLRREIGDLKEVIEGKDFLVQSYKEQKSELSIKIRELQQRLDSKLPNIL